ncbi:hypothetical protein OF83DRAFT_1169742, partial [Amylostereum chailletii]
MSTADHSESAPTIAPFIPVIAVQAGLFGAYTLLIIQSTYVLLHKNLRLRSIQWMLGVTGLMYIASATHLASDLYDVLSSFRPGRSTAAFVPHRMVMLALTCMELNVLLSDAVVIWRVWILWGRNKFVLTSCSVLYISTLAMVGLTTYQQSAPDPPNRLESEYGLRGGMASVASLCLSLATNLWSTALIAYKAWHYRRNISAYLQRGDRKSMVEKLLALLLESGAIYSCIQFAWVVSFMFWGSQTEPSIILELITPHIVPQISGIYPTIIIVLRCNKKSMVEKLLTLLLESGAIYSCIQVVFLVAFALSPRQSESSVILKLIMPRIVPHISGIYPTIIIVLVCFQKTHCDRQFTYPGIEVAG